LHVCDKCGTTLSDDNVAHCYTAEPKRPCIETRAGDSSSTQCNGDSPNTSVAAVSSPVSPSTADAAVRPQALYVNVNNQAFPVLGVAATTASASRPFVTTHANSSVSRPSPTTVLASSQSSVSVTRSSQNAQTSGQPRPANFGSSVTLPSFSLQPPQPCMPNMTRIPVQQSLVSTTLNTPVQSATVAPAVSSAYVFQVNAVQIRLGAKKFKPLTAVTFKDDGVLFTLTGVLMKLLSLSVSFSFIPLYANYVRIISISSRL